ncbi:hypothetical protein IOLA_190 [uncultured bacterium]|nr:hypothetical protein IOLA_190 [uncultured bacterium]
MSTRQNENFKKIVNSNSYIKDNLEKKIIYFTILISLFIILTIVFFFKFIKIQNLLINRSSLNNNENKCNNTNKIIDNNLEDLNNISNKSNKTIYEKIMYKFNFNKKKSSDKKINNDLDIYKSLCKPMISINVKYAILSKNIVDTLVNQVEDFIKNQKLFYIFDKKNKNIFNY